MKLKSNEGFSLIIAVGLIFLISMLALYLIEYMIPFSRNVKGIENSSKSYYEANSGLEEAIWVLNRNNIGTNSGQAIPLGSLGHGFNLVGTGKYLPYPGEGNSKFDSNWNRIKQGEPIQLSVGNSMPTSFNNIEIKFRIPDLNIDGIYNETLSGVTFLPIINWQLSGSGDTLSASGSSYITVNDLNTSSNNLYNFGIHNSNGTTLTGTPMTFGNFYSNNCSAPRNCTLKISVVNKIELNTNNIPVPYLEWQIIDPSFQLSLRFARITGEGKSYGFKKTLDVKLSQNTGIEAFDFAVIQ